MPPSIRLARNFFPLLLLVTVFIPFASASGPYVIGSANTVTADPNVARPSTKPCVVPLFSGAQFFDFNVENFNYAPPSACPGPWAKVVLEADISLNAGIQYDRTANFWLGPVNIYFGTTAEPSNIGPSWHIENDLTDYSSIFYSAQTGQADIGNTLCCGLTSTIFASASLEFYPLAKGETAPIAADQVLALSGGSSGGTVALNTTSSTLSGTFTFPTNVEEAYLDVYSQSQSNDEFWYTCVANDVAAELENCGNTGFRETEITIDGQPAGVAPVSPWVFTGGIDPYLWAPIPGVQTLNFKPYRVNLTPFAGLLSNGSPHTVSVSVYNADSYFSDTASLLLYLDAGTTQVTGAITKNTLTAAPSPVVTENLNVQPAVTKGTVNLKSNRSFTISGYVNTSHGKVTTKIAQNVNFFNNQYYDITSTQYLENISLGSSVWSTTTTSRGGDDTTVTTQSFSFPLTMDLNEFVVSSGDTDLTTKASQTYESFVSTWKNNWPVSSSFQSNSGQHEDTVDFNTFLNSNQSASQQYFSWDSTSKPYFCVISAKANLLTAFSPGCAK
jgi:Peptide N-acetyl-beta-D-glucosaminyl asparaginase amidase A